MRFFVLCAVVLAACQSAPRAATPAPRAVASTEPCATASACASRCQDDEAEACFRSGIYFANGVEVAKDPARALALLDHACELGSAVACLNAGIDLQDGVGTAPDAVKAAARFKRGCDLSDGRACNYLAVAYANGSGVAQDWPRAMSLTGRACDLGSPTGCANAAHELLDGFHHLEPDSKRADQLFARGCEMPGGAGFSSCLELAKSYRMGRGVARDPGAARIFEAKANVRLSEGCDDGMPHACLQLSKHLEQGIGVEADAEKAASLRRWACELAQRQECPSPGNSCQLSIAECRQP
jgi:TPR repeat protein